MMQELKLKLSSQAAAMHSLNAQIKTTALAQLLMEKKLKERAPVKDTLVLVPNNIFAPEPTAVIEDDTPVYAASKDESFSLDIVLNEKQLSAVEMAMSGKSFVLTGAAGTGKTLTQRRVAEILLQDQKLSTTQFKRYTETGGREYVSAPSIAFVSYTRKAAGNLAKAILKSPTLASSLRYNIMTIHTLLEYEPETYWDPIEDKDKFRFSPKRTAKNPLTITHLVIEESSMLGLDLWEKLYDALPTGIQIIFIGDLNQLPPVFGPSILNYALTQLPVVELTETYRNQGIVLENAHRILRGESIEEDPKFKIIRGNSKTQTGQNKMAIALGKFFETLYKNKDKNTLDKYDPEDCIILSPFNKQDLGTDNMNKWIAQFLGAERGAIVHEIIAGFNKVYLAEGDKVMFNKRDAIITKIEKNSRYFGKEPQLCGADLTRFGIRIIGAHTDIDMDAASNLDYSNFSLTDLEDETAERKMQASHAITITYGDGTEDTLSAAGDFGPACFSLGYVLTVHKAQGSEWRKVFLILHKDHSIMSYRELLYTAVTRAREEVSIIAKDFMVEKAIKTQRIKGDTLEDKIEFFNSGINNALTVECVK